MNQATAIGTVKYVVLDGSRIKKVWDGAKWWYTEVSAA